MIVDRPSPNHGPRRPEGRPVDILLLHYTGMQTAETALTRLCDPDTGVSAHYTIDEDGTVYAHVPEMRRAWHAGESCWAGDRDVNSRSIGIELVNPGHEWGYRPFPDLQIEALIALARGILNRYPIPPEHVLGHTDVAWWRKQDPGDLFPWQRIADAGVGAWPGPAALLPTEGLETNSLEPLRNYGYWLPSDTDLTPAFKAIRQRLGGTWCRPQPITAI